jgi:cell division protein FtsQ
MLKKRLKRLVRSMERKSRADWLRYLYVSGLAVAVAAFGWGLYRVVVFAHNTESLEIRSIQVTGERRVTESEILARAGFTPGTNALRVSLEDTRHAVEQILWVRHATVQRVWPNQLAITVVERDPVALARIDGEIYQVDIDGVTLSVDTWTNTNFPILDGLKLGDAEADIADNAVKIGIYRETLETLGENQLSEVHVSEAGDVSVVPVDDPVMVDLGIEDHRDRWDRYQSLKTQIREDYPTALRIDLRFRDQIIIQTEQADDDEPAERIIWDEETKLL